MTRVLDRPAGHAANRFELVINLKTAKALGNRNPAGTAGHR
jgi:hypothetical protein